jgi:hypothetical protein
MVHPLDNKRNTIHKDNSKGSDTERMIDILHQNIRSSKRKYRELQVLLHTDFNNVDILCFTEHWLNHQHIEAIQFDNFMLTSKFCRMNDGGGSCIYVKKEIRMKELNDLEYLGEVKNFELSIIELIDYKIILICIYRSPNGKFEVFLNRL